MKLIPVATAPDQLVAEMWRDLLAQEGIPATIRAGDTISFMGLSAFPCRLLVPEEQADSAREVLDRLTAPGVPEE